MDTKGNLVDWSFTYNYGLMIGAATMLHNTDPNNLSQWNQALAYVKNLLSSGHVVNTPKGPALSDGDANSCAGDCQQFKGPTARYLRMFYEVGLKYHANEPLLKRVYEVLQGSAYAIANVAINWDDWTFGVQWAGPSPKQPYNDMQNNVAIQGLSAFAEICHMSPPATCQNSVGVGLSSSGVSELKSSENKAVTSPDCKMRLVLQPDGNLVVYNDKKQAVWAAMSFGTNNRAVLQPDGNLVVYNGDNKPLWASGSWGKGIAPFFVSLDNSGRLSLKDNTGALLWTNL